MHRKLGLSIAAVSLLALNASSVALAGPLKACDLMTQQAAAAILGDSVRPGGTEIDSNGVLTCLIGGAGEDESITVSLTGSNPYGVSATAMFQIATKPNKGETVESISGLGESSSWRVGQPNSTLVILYHGEILAISVSGSKNPGVKTTVIQSAKQILSKL